MKMNVISIKIPVKITLFGEHAVVYNKPAIASTIPVFINILGRSIKEKKLIIEFNDINIPTKKVVLDKITNTYVLVPNEIYISRFISYIATGLDICKNELQITDEGGYEIRIESTLPIGAGLGTSAAISVGTIALCVLLSYNKDVEDPSIRKIIALLAWKTEQKVQGMASPMDTFTITYGGLRYIKPWIPEAEYINSPNQLNIIVGYTPKKFTTAELVKNVKNLKVKEEKIIEKLLDIIGEIVEEARDAIIKNDVERLGTLMNVNHGVLEALGIVSLDHSYIIKTLIAAGALGAKTSGAGGGGAFIALAKNKIHATLLKNIAEALGARIVAMELYEKGFIINNDSSRVLKDLIV
uniref:Mevalonate kinase n=1 Tax=Ignisphaera aggregans TaxID=334771 RepID=A0A7C5TJJ2_9CREN